MSQKQFALIITALYCTLILTSLGDPVMVLSAGEALFGYRLDLILSLFPYAIIALFLVYLTFVSKEKQPWRFLFLIVVSIALFFVMRLLYGPEEKLHLIEFSILGGLIGWAASMWGVSLAVVYGVVVALGVIVVGSDEYIQVLLSLKIFSARDVLINSMSALLGAVVNAGLFLDRQKAEDDA